MLNNLYLAHVFADT